VTHAASKYVVRFADLDVSKIEGASALYTRLSHAAGVVCEPLPPLLAVVVMGLRYKPRHAGAIIRNGESQSCHPDGLREAGHKSRPFPDRALCGSRLCCGVCQRKAARAMAWER
jgi:hypothetical protein